MVAGVLFRFDAFRFKRVCFGFLVLVRNTLFGPLS